MTTSITWYGHANFLISTPDCIIAIDPFFTGNPKAPVRFDEIPEPDIVLVTHLHGDHQGDAVAICHNNSKTRLGAIVGAGEILMGQGVPPEQIINGIGFNIGGTIQINNVSITMTEAFHTSEAGAPAGYIITTADGFTVYHAGDTGIFSNMQTWGQLYPIDLALLPIGGVFTMDGRQAALAAKMLKAKRVIPMHYGTFPVLAANAECFRQELHGIYPECECIIPDPGEKLIF